MNKVSQKQIMVASSSNSIGNSGTGTPVFNNNSPQELGESGRLSNIPSLKMISENISEQDPFDNSKSVPSLDDIEQYNKEIEMKDILEDGFNFGSLSQADKKIHARVKVAKVRSERRSLMKARSSRFPNSVRQKTYHFGSINEDPSCLIGQNSDSAVLQKKKSLSLFPVNQPKL